MDKKTLSERDICTKFVTPAINHAGWEIQSQIREPDFDGEPVQIYELGPGEKTTPPIDGEHNGGRTSNYKFLSRLL